MEMNYYGIVREKLREVGLLEDLVPDRRGVWFEIKFPKRGRWSYEKLAYELKKIGLYLKNPNVRQDGTSGYLEFLPEQSLTSHDSQEHSFLETYQLGWLCPSCQKAHAPWIVTKHITKYA